MAKEYAKKQPPGFKNYIENVAIVGAGGHVGRFIAEGLLKTGRHKVTAITRENSTSKLPAGVQVKKVDYDKQETLVKALQGQDALIITMGVSAPKDQQTKLIDAAAAANVAWILPNEFGADPDNVEIAKDTFLESSKLEYRKHVEQLGKSSWIGFVCWFWYEFSLGGGPERYGFDFKNRKVIIFDDGTARINTTTWPQCGRAVAKLLSLKVLPDDEDDVGKGPTLSDFRNGFVYVSSFHLSQKDMLDSVLRVTGTSVQEWKIEHEPVKQRFHDGIEEFKRGDMSGFAKLLYSRIFFPDVEAVTKTGDHLHNDILNLPKEDLDEYTQAAIVMANAEGSNVYGS